MRKLSLTFWFGLLFIGGGVVLAITGNYASAVASITFGIALVLLGPESMMKQPKGVEKAPDGKSQPPEKGPRKKELWGIELTTRNAAALVFLAASVITFAITTWSDFAK